MVPVLLALLLACATTAQGALQETVRVPDVAYELFKATHNGNMSSVLYVGCSAFFDRYPIHETLSLSPASKITIVASQCGTAFCGSTANAPKLRAQPSGRQGLAVSCGTSQWELRGDMVVADLHEACEGQEVCSPANVLELMQLAQSAGAKRLFLVNWHTHKLDMLSLEASPYSVTTYTGRDTGGNAAEAFTAFSSIYNHENWGKEGGGSGPGSSLNYTATLRDELVKLITKYEVTTIMDAPCEAMVWMPKVLEQFPTVRYIGLDVVCHLIQRHRRTFSALRNMHFHCVDIAHQELPKLPAGASSLVFSRDALQHLPLSYIFKFLANVKASGAKYLLVGSYVKDPSGNREIPIGQYFPVDLLKAPFNASAPLEILDEKTPDGKHMLLFDVEKMTWLGPGAPAAGPQPTQAGR